ncbi:10643_t:CDS:1, partial [Dentiscutata erythropus]
MPVKRVTERLCMVSIPNILQINVDDSDGPEVNDDEINCDNKITQSSR